MQIFVDPFIGGYRAVSTTDTATTADRFLKLSGASFTQTLYSPVGNAGRRLRVKHTGTSLSQVYTISGTGLSGVALYTNGETWEFESDGTNWVITNHYWSTAWTAYTPTLGTGFGTATNISYFYRRTGDEMQVRGTHTNGTVAGSLASVSLPSGASLDSAKISINNTTAAAGMRIGLGWGNGAANSYCPIVTAPATSTTLVYCGNVISGTNTHIPGNGSGPFSSSAVTSLTFSVPISGWLA